MIHPILFFCSTALLLCAPTISSQQSAPLTIWTRDAQLAERVWQMLPRADEEAAVEFEALGNGEVYRVSLDEAGSVEAVAVASDDDAEFRLDLDPRAFLARFEAQAKQLRLQVRGLIGATYSSIGLTYEDAAMIVDGIFDFPKQLARVGVRVTRTGDAETAEWSITCRLIPVADSTTARVHGALAHGVRTMPRLDLDGEMLRADVCVDWPALFGVLEPHLEPLARMWTRSKSERENAKRLFAASMRSFDGSMHLTMRNVDAEVYVLAGLTDAAAFAELCADPDYLAQAMRAAAAGGQATPTFEQAVLQHRGVSFDRLTTEIDNPALVNPAISAAGPFVTLRGVVGDRLLSITGTAPSHAAVVDALLDEKATVPELPADTFLMLDMRFDEWIHSVAGPWLGDDQTLQVPELMGLRIVKEPTALRIDIRLH